MPPRELITNNNRPMKSKGIYNSPCGRRKTQMEVIDRRRANISKWLEVEPSELLTAKEVCELLGVSLYCIHLWRKQGLIHNYGIKTAKFYKKSEVLSSYLSTNTK